jgi:hypothetical protein
MWKAKTQVFGWLDVVPGRMSYWTPGRKNSEGVSWKAAKRASAGAQELP